MYIEGNINTKERNGWIAIIGSRNPTKREKFAAKYITNLLASKGYIIVSGLAKGIDTIAHKEAILAKGKTVAILSISNKEKIYPKENIFLAKNIVKNGAIVYPYKTKSKFQKKGFTQFQKRLIERDLLLAELSEIIIVVSDDKIIKGGSRYAINHGQKIGKKTFRYDSFGKFHKKPKTEKININWDLEINLNI